MRVTGMALSTAGDACVQSSSPISCAQAWLWPRRLHAPPETEIIRFAALARSVTLTRDGPGQREQRREHGSELSTNA
jgi:hypothetical protein